MCTCMLCVHVYVHMCEVFVHVPAYVVGEGMCTGYRVFASAASDLTLETACFTNPEVTLD